MDPTPKANDTFWTTRRMSRLREVEQEIHPEEEPTYIIAANDAFRILADQREQLEKIDDLRDNYKIYDIETILNDMYAEVPQVAQLYGDLLMALFEETPSVDERLELTAGLLRSVDISHNSILTKLLGYPPTTFWNEKQMFPKIEDDYTVMTSRQFCEEIRYQISDKMTSMIDELGEAIDFQDEENRTAFNRGRDVLYWSLLHSNRWGVAKW